MSEAWLVVGLGNPGPDYQNTRHNLGFMVTDVLAERLGSKFKASKFRAQVAEGRLGPPGPKLILAQPQQYMNRSGGPTKNIADYYGIGPDHVIAVHDELDLPFGSVKLKLGGGEGGHNGLRDIAKALGTRDFYRVRLGIGRPPSGAVDHVLKPFNAAERKELPWLIEDAADATELLITEGLTAAQRKFHAPKEL